ncbi:MmcQ/YjbR family DNA-binding protein [Halopseudomonas sabulinigri]|uniref:Predicted DNA-binding protein, MmcQ/YjbR family n=1 Tax=Halopseudomonas sabulinigri TaxID=472181 RepID=A0A1H1W2R9_9GAMM|nr:MmcQ/YjbR family DNA-binding protein [Halopseudomonas sabulinigri]SDS91373.1 Predicted DNA-binding protein, MmcQ/YjbR family [Halopseudomonas sabulinigri]
MTVDEVKAYCAALPGASSELHDTPTNVLVYRLAEKRFAYFKTSQPQQWRFSVRVMPERYLELTDQPGIQPARYLQRFHWVTLVSVEQMPAEQLRALIDWSYQKALQALPQGQREALLRG